MTRNAKKRLKTLIILLIKFPFLSKKGEFINIMNVKIDTINSALLPEMEQTKIVKKSKKKYLHFRLSFDINLYSIKGMDPVRKTVAEV